MASGVELATAYIQLVPSLRGAGREVEKQMGPVGQQSGRKFSDDFEKSSKGRIGGAGKRLGSGFGRAFAAGGTLLATAGVASFLKDSIGEAREAQKVGAATESILKATGNAAKLSATDIGNLAGALSNKTGIDDEAIQSGENLLLTFKNVKKEGDGLNDVFGRATQAGLDLAAAGFGSIEGNAVQLGKALNDPTKGIAALAKSGVTFTEGQKKQIKGFVASNDLLSAQKIILGEIEHQVGGTAAATATSGEKAQVAFGNLKEQIGTAVLPVVDKLAGVFANTVAPAVALFVSQMQNGVGAGGTFVSILRGLYEKGLKPIGSFVFGTLVPGIAHFIGGMRDGSGTGGKFADILRGIFDAVRPVGEFIGGTIVPAIAKFIGGMKDGTGSGGKFVEIAGKIYAALKTAAAYVVTVAAPAIARLAVFVGTKLKPVFDQLVLTFQTKVLPALTKVFAKVREAMPTILAITGFILRFVGALIRVAAVVLGKVLPPLIRLAAFLIGKFLGSFTALLGDVARVIGKMIAFGRAVFDAGRKVAEFAGNVSRTVADVVSAVIGGIGSLPGKIAGYASDMVQAGKDFIGGLFDGIRDAAGAAGGLLTDIANSVGEAFRGVINDLIGELNNAIPNKIGKGKFSINLPNNPVPYLAKGTRNFSGGLAVVGEQGPELVTMPRGSRVDTAAATRRIVGKPSALATADSGGGTTALLSVDGQTFRAYLEYVAGGVLNAEQGMNDERSRATWSRSHQ